MDKYDIWINIAVPRYFCYDNWKEKLEQDGGNIFLWDISVNNSFRDEKYNNKVKNV